MRILFVDDEPNILDGLRRMLRSMRDRWEVDFASSGEQALGMLLGQAFDVVVTDMRMPVMSGFELLEKVRAQYPEIMRFVLSGQTDRETALRSATTAHQFLSKPCDPDQLKGAIERASRLRGALSKRELLGLVTKLRNLPTLPALYHQIVEEISSPEPSMARIGQVIEQDVGMTVKILQMVNSAFFGVPRTVSSAAEAVSLLGVETLRALVTAVHVFERFSEAGVAGQVLESLERHSLRTGAIARHIAEDLNLGKMTALRAQIAGILHDVGRVVLAAEMPSAYQGVIRMAAKSGEPWVIWEPKVLGANHAELGGYLLGLWGFPNDLVETVTYHCSPESVQASEPALVDVVHAASAIESESAGYGEDGSSTIDAAYFARKDLTDRFADWRIRFGEVALEGGRHSREAA